MNDLSPTPLPPVPAWKLWENPILRRYARSRLRPAGLAIAILLTLMVTAFLFLVAYLMAKDDFTDPVDIARFPILLLLGIQGLILFGLGTGQTAAGMTNEADEGVLDYQRLAPLTPMVKVLGFLFGLPIKEWILFIVTLPFTFFCLWRGDVPIGHSLALYGVFLVAAIVYHLTGLLTGTIMKNRRWAFLGSMGLLFLLYIVIPQAAKIGIIYFKYLTIYPVIGEIYPSIAPWSERLPFARDAIAESPANFFNLRVPEYLLTLVALGSLCLIMGMMLCRRWRDMDSHLLSKPVAVIFFVWVNVMLLGNAIPLITSGEIFPTRATKNFVSERLDGDFDPTSWTLAPTEALGLMGVFGVVTIVLSYWLLSIMTPDQTKQIRGWQGAHKRGTHYLKGASDAASSFPWALLLAALGLAAWLIFSQTIMDSEWYQKAKFDSFTKVAMSLTLVSSLLLFQNVLELKGSKAAFLMIIFVVVLPVMVTIIVVMMNEAFEGLAIWIGGISPATWPFLGIYSSFPGMEGSANDTEISKKIFWFWQAVALGSIIWLSLRLRKARRRISIQASHPPTLS